MNVMIAPLPSMPDKPAAYPMPEPIGRWWLAAALVLAAAGFACMLPYMEGMLKSYSGINAIQIEWMDQLLDTNASEAANDAVGLNIAYATLDAFTYIIPVAAALLLQMPLWIMVFVLVYKGWKSIQAVRVFPAANQTKLVSPGIAVVLLCIPYFNFYWVFPAYARLARYGQSLCNSLGIPYRGPGLPLAISYASLPLATTAGVFAVFTVLGLHSSGPSSIIRVFMPVVPEQWLAPLAWLVLAWNLLITTLTGLFAFRINMMVGDLENALPAGSRRG